MQTCRCSEIAYQCAWWIWQRALHQNGYVFALASRNFYFKAAKDK
jgi:hypothetical protein